MTKILLAIGSVLFWILVIGTVAGVIRDWWLGFQPSASRIGDCEAV